MGNCYEKLNKKNEATRCYERAENGKDKEGRDFLIFILFLTSSKINIGIALF